MHTGQNSFEGWKHAEPGIRWSIDTKYISVQSYNGVQYIFGFMIMHQKCILITCALHGRQRKFLATLNHSSRLWINTISTSNSSMRIKEQNHQMRKLISYLTNEISYAHIPRDTILAPTPLSNAHGLLR